MDPYLISFLGGILTGFAAGVFALVVALRAFKAGMIQGVEQAAHAAHRAHEAEVTEPCQCGHVRAMHTAGTGRWQCWGDTAKRPHAERCRCREFVPAEAKS